MKKTYFGVLIGIGLLVTTLLQSYGAVELAIYQNGYWEDDFFENGLTLALSFSALMITVLVAIVLARFAPSLRFILWVVLGMQIIAWVFAPLAMKMRQVILPVSTKTSLVGTEVLTSLFFLMICTIFTLSRREMQQGQQHA